MERLSGATSIRRFLAWFWFVLLSYILLAVAIYVPLFWFSAPGDYSHISTGFWVGFWIAIALHQVLALGSWLLFATRLHMDPPVVASAICLTILGAPTVLLFLLIFALSSLAIE